MLIIERAKEADAEEITDVAIATFREDNKLKPEGASMEGPPGHDSIDSQRSWIKDCYYYKASLNEKIIGVCLVWKKSDDEYVIDGMSVHPDYQNQGFGQKIINYVFNEHKSVKKWSLSTPSFSKRNHHFYEKLGFVKIAEMESGAGWLEYYYEKKL